MRWAGQTSFSYDANGNLLLLTDALSHTTGYTYDDSHRVATRTDPLTHTASYSNHFNGHETEFTDRKGRLRAIPTTRSTGSHRSRLTTNRPLLIRTMPAIRVTTEIADSVNGTITRQYHGLNRLTQETTQEGTISYTYDLDGRRATMTVSGQNAVTYNYDDAHRLISIKSGLLYRVAHLRQREPEKHGYVSQRDCGDGRLRRGKSGDQHRLRAGADHAR